MGIVAVEMKTSVKSVIAFAENVLAHGRDRYRAEPTPLFADGIEMRTGGHLRWGISPARRAAVSNLACQQNLLRTLTALTDLTGEPRYREAAEAALRYHFAHYLDSSGLLQWGGHRFLDLESLTPTGPADKGMVHELKNCFPFYELLFALDPEVTARYIRAFWTAHIYDWDQLYLGRHGKYGLEPGDPWAHPLVDPPVFRPSPGLSFLNTGNDLIYAAGLLHRYRGEEGALRWARHLARQYVRARHPETGLGAYQFTQPRQTAETMDDAKTTSNFGDRAKRQFGPEFGEIALEGNMLLHHHAATIYGANALIQLRLAVELGAEAAELLEWTRQGLTSFAKYAYDETANAVKPMFTDGRDLSGYVLRRDGYFGRAGQVLQREQAGGRFLLSFVRCHLQTRDDYLWRIARRIGRSNRLGDLGPAPGADVRPALSTRNAPTSGRSSPSSTCTARPGARIIWPSPRGSGHGSSGPLSITAAFFLDPATPMPNWTPSNPWRSWHSRRPGWAGPRRSPSSWAAMGSSTAITTIPTVGWRISRTMCCMSGGWGKKLPNPRPFL